MSGLNRATIFGALAAALSAPIGVGRAGLAATQNIAVDSDGNPARYRGGPGFTAAHVKRMAKKRRNQQRHKKACRGSAAFR